MPERLGDFLIIGELGRGGMGVVYEAFQESLGRLVALKVLHLIHLDDKRRQRFQREALAVAQLHHTNIVPIFGVGEHEGLPYYVMQYIRGSGLDVLLGTWRRQGSPRGEPRWRFVARVGVQAAEAIQYAHEQGVLHRDIKPANLLIDEHHAVWITDFGLAKLTGHDDLTASGDVIGTLRYLPPEALRGETDRRSDVYSLGMTLYELITLNPPFGELSPSALLRSVSEGEPTRPRRLDPAIPRDLETIVLKAIAREPDRRYATAVALAEDLRRFLEDRPIRARRATTFERLWRWSRRNRTIAALAATAAGSLLVAAIVGWAGYMSTTEALERESKRRGEAELATRRSEQNVALSLEVFGDLFERLAAQDDLSPPPLGRSGRQPSPGSRGGSSAPGPPRREIAGEETALLRSVLTFYDRFARQNATDPRLQGEAAWAYRKVGALYQRLARDEEAETAYARAIAMFEELAARHPAVPAYRFKLVDTYDMADPWSADPSSLERLEQRLRRARALIDALAAESPEDEDYALARVHMHAKLGVALQRLERAEDAEACYRGAIALEGELIGRWPRNGRLRIDRAITREALIRLQLERGRRDEARALLEEAAVDLQSFATDQRMRPPPPERFVSLAEVFQRLGEPGRAEEMARWANEIGARPPQNSPGPPDRDAGPSRPAEEPP